MFKVWFGKFDKKIFYSLAVLSLTAAALLFAAKFNTADAQGKGDAETSRSRVAAPAVTFPANAGTLGPIPDNNPALPRDVTFTVSGLTGTLSNVEVSHTYGSPIHTWVGDLNVTLIAPGGASHVLYGRTGQTGASAGDSSDLSGPYVMKDSAAGTNWWAAAFAAAGAAVVPPGDYRTTAAGPQPVTNTSPVTNLTAAFASVPNPNGTWTLRFTDNAGGDTGAVSAASLTLTTAVNIEANADFTGDGKTDFSMVRDNTPALAGNEFYRLESVREKLRYLAENPPQSSEDLVPGTNLIWFINNSTSNADTITSFGQPTTDFIVPSDYDGDGRADIAIWRPGAPTVAAFYIFQSQTSTVRMELFGQTGDDPAITGDYDGDGKSDIATYRCPALGAGDGQCFFFYRGSLNNPSGNVTYVPWGFGESLDFFVNPGDFDGDGKFDFCIQRTAPSGSPSAQFVLLKSGGGPIEYINWGLNTDLIVPGDYDGDGRNDFCVSRTETIGVNAGRSYYILERDGGGTGAGPIRWGIAGDVRTPGDYDGDGKTDIAIWRPNATPSMSTYYVLRSSNGALQTFGYGNQGDFAVPGWNVH